MCSPCYINFLLWFNNLPWRIHALSCLHHLYDDLGRDLHRIAILKFTPYIMQLLHEICHHHAIMSYFIKTQNIIAHASCVYSFFQSSSCICFNKIIGKDLRFLAFQMLLIHAIQSMLTSKHASHACTILWTNLCS